MYADGYAPNFYWKYSRRGRLSCSDVHYWLEKNPEAALKIRSPVSKVPPLPAAIMCMCMMPTTAEGLSMVPGRLQPLLNPGSPFREVLDRYSGSDLDIPAVLRALQQVAPEEILNILDDSHKRWVLSLKWVGVKVEACTNCRSSWCYVFFRTGLCITVCVEKCRYEAEGWCDLCIKNRIFDQVLRAALLAVDQSLLSAAAATRFVRCRSLSQRDLKVSVMV